MQLFDAEMRKLASAILDGNARLLAERGECRFEWRRRESKFSFHSAYIDRWKRDCGGVRRERYDCPGFLRDQVGNGVVVDSHAGRDIVELPLAGERNLRQQARYVGDVDIILGRLR